MRNYPLRPVNEPPVFVMGDRQGQKVFPNAPGMPNVPIPPGAGGSYTGIPGMGLHGNAPAMLQHQNSTMEALDRRAQRDRGMSMGQVCVHPFLAGAFGKASVGHLLGCYRLGRVTAIPCLRNGTMPCFLLHLCFSRGGRMMEWTWTCTRRLSHSEPTTSDRPAAEVPLHKSSCLAPHNKSAGDSFQRRHYKAMCSRPLSSAHP